MDGIYVPIVGSICLAVIFIVFSYLSSRTQAEVHKTIRATLEAGTVLTPDLVEKLNTRSSAHMVDFRRGIIITSIGLSTAAAGVITGAVMEFATIAVFPIFMGIGFLLVWKMNKSNN